MTADTQALLSELARVKVLFQLRTVAAIINGGIVCTDDGCERIYLGAAHHADTINNTTDEHSEWLGIGGGDFIQHGADE